jgi:hypothetical protein
LINKELIQKHGDPQAVYRLLNDRGWKTLEDAVKELIRQEQEVLSQNLVVDEKSAAKHNRLVGRIEVMKELLSYPELAVK